VYADPVVEVIVTDEFEAWYMALEREEAPAVTRVIDLLAEKGVTLGEPHSSAIRGSKCALRELRPKAGRSPLRVFYAFDPRRQAVLLIGGDKSGDPRFYDAMIPKAEKLWATYLEETK
jgi:hypothetical protein